MNAPGGSVSVDLDEGDVALLTLRNPSKLNAISPHMWHTMSDTLVRFADVSNVRCVVLISEGDKAFCVIMRGADRQTAKLFSYISPECSATTTMSASASIRMSG